VATHPSRISDSFQSLVTLFAAGLALAGVWLTVTAQTQNVANQLKAQREQFSSELAERRATEERAVVLRQRQVASAFIGEITVIMAAFRGPDWRDVPNKALQDLERMQETATPTLRLTVSRPTGDYAIFFRANAAEVGQFPQPVPQKLLMFYRVYTQLQDNLAQISRASDEDFTHMEVPSVEHALRDQLQQLDSLEQVGRELIPLLQKIADQTVP
jgi:hypothetical protein